MFWDMNNYPSSLKNFKSVIRKKAIEIANAMVEEGYDEVRAIPIATKQAKDWYAKANQKEIKDFEQNEHPIDRWQSKKRSIKRPMLVDKVEHVVPHDENWAVKAEGAEQPSDVFETKSEAIDRGKEIAKNKRTYLSIHRKDGTVEEQISFKDAKH